MTTPKSSAPTIHRVEDQKTAVITGANTGLGLQTALALARKGVKIVMACRNLQKAGVARAGLLAEAPGADITIRQLDVADPASIRGFGEDLLEDVGPVDVLINNAGIIGASLERTAEGFEMHFATNYLGCFALTGTLLPCFRKGAGARIVNVGSLAHRFAKIDLANLNWERGGYRPMRAYARSKVAVLAFTLELERRLRFTGSDVIALAAHPGFAATEIATRNTTIIPDGAFGRWVVDKMAYVIPAAERAARPVVHAAVAEDVRGGDHYGPSGLFEIAGATGRAKINPRARDVDVARRLWAASEAMTGVRFLSEY